MAVATYSRSINIIVLMFDAVVWDMDKMQKELVHIAIQREFLVDSNSFLRMHASIKEIKMQLVEPKARIKEPVWYYRHMSGALPVLLQFQKNMIMVAMWRTVEPSCSSQVATILTIDSLPRYKDNSQMQILTQIPNSMKQTSGKKQELQEKARNSYKIRTCSWIQFNKTFQEP